MINKHLMTGPKENSEFCFPETLNVPRGEAKGNIEGEGKQISLFPRNQSLSVLLYLPTQNQKKSCEEIICFTPADSHICRGFKEYELITCESKAHVVSLGI